jgi:hypothetical protein
MKTIAITFAGRRDRMTNELKFMNAFIESNIVDEWHIWNFSRNADDNNWLINSFSTNSEYYTTATSHDYLQISSTPRTQFDISVKAIGNAHIKLTLSGNEIIECVFGSVENTKSILRTFNFGQFASFLPPLLLADAPLKVGNNEIKLQLTNGVLLATLNDVTIFSYPTNAALINDIRIHTGYGASGIWKHASDGSKIKIININSKGNDGYNNCYKYYCASDFSDAIFIKIDDDIIFCDSENIASFIKAVSQCSDLAIWSANVMNNGVCAYFQKEKGYFPDHDLNFEYPPKGFGGTLWESAQLCGKLHQYFIDNSTFILQKARASKEPIELPQMDRLSTNFVAFKYPIMIMMALARELTKINDDEHLMTVSLPALFGIKKYIFENMIVSHLSFYKQEVEGNLRATEIASQYTKRFYPSV